MVVPLVLSVLSCSFIVVIVVVVVRGCACTAKRIVCAVSSGVERTPDMREGAGSNPAQRTSELKIKMETISTIMVEVEKNFGVRVRKNDTVKILEGAHKGKLAFVEHATMFIRMEHDWCSDGFVVGQLLNVFVEDVGRIQLTDADVALPRDLLVERMRFWESRRRILKIKGKL